MDSFDIKMETSLVTVTKNISWTIQNISKVSELESLPFSVFDNSPLKWVLCLKIRQREYTALYIKKFESKDLPPLEVFISGTMYFKNYENEILHEEDFDLNSDTDLKECLYKAYRYQDDFKERNAVFYPPGGSLIIEGKISFSRYKTRMLTPSVIDEEKKQLLDNDPKEIRRKDFANVFG